MNEIASTLTAMLQAGSLSAILSQPWAVDVPRLAHEYMQGRFRLRIGPDAEGPQKPMKPDHPCDLWMIEEAGLAIQPVRGVIYPGCSPVDEYYYGEFNTDRIARCCAMVAANPSIKTMVFQMNTPGGSVYGLHSAAQAIADLHAKRKDVACIAWVSHLCASAGMYLAAACEQIHAAPGALVGSIGTIASLTDTKGLFDKLGMTKYLFTADSKLKGLGTGGITPSPDQLNYMDGMVKQYSAEFKDWMKKRRGLSDSAMQGQCFEARLAPPGMVDSTAFTSMEHMLAAGMATL